MEVKRRRKQSIFRYLNPRNLVSEVNRYGYHFSLSGFWKFYLFAFLSILVISILYQLQIIYILCILIFSLVMSPFIILNTYRGLYEQKRFLDVSNYLEQLLYSFRKIPKILSSLEDALIVFPEGQMHDAIMQTMDHIQNKTMEQGENIYENAFVEMEGFYNCRRMKQVHDFLVKVESFGGDFTSAIDILLEDRRLWVERVYELEKERKHLKTKITISLVLSFLICGLTMVMLPKDFQTLDNMVCQVATTALMVSNLLIWYMGQKRLSADWLDDLKENKEEIKRYYDLVTNSQVPKKKGLLLGKAVVCFFICAVGVFFGSVPVMLIGGGAIVFTLMQPGMMQRIAKKKILREVDKAFPVWIMELSLFLQTDNPQVALTKSVAHAPYVLKADLEKMIDGIQKNPANIAPYLNFMSQFDLPDVQSALRMLYSMSESGTSEFSKQILFLIERNNRLLDKAERMANEDKISGTSMLVLVPMVTGSIKMMVDLGVFLISLLSMTTGV